MAILDPITHGFQPQGAWLEKYGEHPATRVLPSLVQQLHGLYCPPVACKAAVLTCRAVCDVLLVRAWLRGRARLSSASTATSQKVQPTSADDEAGHGASQNAQTNVVRAVMQGHRSAALVLLLSFGAGVGCAAWRQRRAAVARRKPKACKILLVATESPSSTSRTTSTESLTDRWGKISRTPSACGDKIRRNFPKAKMPSNTQTAFQLPPLGGTNFEPESEHVTPRERNSMSGKAGNVARLTAEFDNKVPFFRMGTEGRLMLNHTDRIPVTKDVDVVPEGSVRAYAQEAQSELAMHGTGELAELAGSITCTTALGHCWETLVRRCSWWLL